MVVGIQGIITPEVTLHSAPVMALEAFSEGTAMYGLVMEALPVMAATSTCGPGMPMVGTVRAVM